MKNERLFSLDILRGLDMILLTVIGPVFAALRKTFTIPPEICTQFTHQWGGFTLWDIIMPLFIFMCGAAIPYALSKRLDENGRPTPAFWGHVISRVTLLWFLGMLAQGNLASLDPDKFHPYNNTLQTIAAGYLIAALVMLIPSRAARISAPLVLAAIYGLLLHFLGDYSKAGNFASIVETKITQAILPATNKYVLNSLDPKIGVPDHGYTWFLTTLMFSAMTMCGVQAAEILRGKTSEKHKARALFIYGGALLGAGWLLVPMGVPMIKQIFTVSFTAQAMGWSVLALAVLYVVTDVWKIRRGWWFAILFGQCALTAYMANGFFRPALSGAAGAIARGFPNVIGEKFTPLATALVTVALLTFVVWVRRRLRVASRALAAEKEPRV